MPPRSVLVTYTLNPTLPAPSTGIRSPLTTALDGIRSQLPLTNLHWKSSTRPALRTIQTCDVNLVELGEVGMLGKHVGGSVLEWPLVNLCLVTCENDEMYKTQTKSFVRDWLSLLAARRNVHAPLIVLVNTASVAASSGKNVFGRDKGVIAKLRADFNTAKRDRCVQINLPPEGRDDPAVWVEIINKLKESIVTAFDGAILEREEEVKRGEAQRLTVGWNFCTWFLLKESLAHSFEGVNLHEDALVVYEELEAAFLQIVKEQNLSWFGKLGATGPRDDSLPVLDTTAKPYRDLLQSSMISIFDFRVYVFARQAQLLGKLGRITEIAKRGQWFVASLTRRLRESEADLAENFIESWTYTACMDIVHRCDEWSRIDRPNGDYSGLMAYESARSELLDIARVQVERIGVSAGHLPNVYPFAPSSALATVNDDVLFESSDNGLPDTEDPELPTPRSSLSNQQLLEAVADVNNLRALYFTLTKRAISAYEACHKANSVLRLKADLAGLALLREDWKIAYGLCRDLVKECVDLNVWEPASKFALSGALGAHGKLGLEKDEDWSNLALAYLEVLAMSEEQLEEEDLSELKDVIGKLRAEGVKSQITEAHRAFQIRLIGDQISHAKEGDTITADVEVINRLPTVVSIETLLLDFIDSAGEQIGFRESGLLLQPGSNRIVVTCTTSVQGVFYLRESRLLLGNIIMSYPVSGSGLGGSLKVTRAINGVMMRLRMPYNISLDKDSSVVLEIHAGECSLNSGRISLFSLQDDVQYMLESAQSDSGNSVSVEYDSILIGDLAADSSISLNIAYSGVTSTDYAKARLELNYKATDGAERRVVDTQKISMGLPLTVNVQDFFRQECLVSHFTIASDGREYLRIGSVKLVPSEETAYDVESAREDWSETTVVSPTQPLSSLFRIRKKAKPSISSSNTAAVLRLVITYMGIEEEVEEIINEFSGLAGDRKLSNRIRSVMEDRSTWLQSYVATKCIEPSFAAALRIGNNTPSGEKTIESLVASFKQKNEKTGRWRTLEIPVDVPQRRLLSKVRFHHTSVDGMIYEGRALAMNVTLTTVFGWSGSKPEEGIRLVWDVVAGQDDWVILGRKKGFYVAEPNQSVTQEIVIVPVRPGRLFLPAVQVQHLAEPSYAPPGQGGNTLDEGVSPLICETFVENAGDVIHVLPAKSSRTVLVPIGGAAREWDG